MSLGPERPVVLESFLTIRLISLRAGLSFLLEPLLEARLEDLLFEVFLLGILFIHKENSFKKK
jgi:hypothetical protein